MQVKLLLIPREAEGERADSFLLRYLPELPEAIVRKAFQLRDVKLDGKRISRETRVSAGQEIRIFYPDQGSRDPLDVVYEDEDVLLVNKRPGISVESDARGGTTLTDLCLSHVRCQNLSGFPPTACHRLDNQTSGLCLFAKNENALLILQDVFRKHHLEKDYECLVRGIPKPPRAVCHAFLVKDARKGRVEITDMPVPGSREIITGYETMSQGPVSRLRVRLYTGRTHQIRAHMAALGHPLLGDDLYGDRSFNRFHKVRTLRLCAVCLRVDTEGRLPALDQKRFSVSAPF